MHRDILTHIEDPVYLEKLYRKDKSEFKKAFEQIYPNLTENKLARFWHERLIYDTESISWGTKKQFLFVILLSLFAGLLAKIPQFTSINEEFYYPRNSGFLFLPAVALYFFIKNDLPHKKAFWITGILLALFTYINLLPDNPQSDTLTLACIHLPFVLWGLSGLTYSGIEINSFQKKLAFLNFNGDWVLISGLLVIAGGILTAVTLGLFELIGLKIEEFYFQNIVIVGLPMVPIVAAHICDSNPQLVSKVSPMIAKLFSPLVLVMLLAYLSAMVITGQDPYNDREFLLFFNILLIGVMALIFFSIAGNLNTQKHKTELWLLIFLAIITSIVNLTALSAIIYRIAEWGITPNRIAVLGANILMIIHLIFISKSLILTVLKNIEMREVKKSIVAYIPIYILWSLIVVFIFPLAFGFS